MYDFFHRNLSKRESSSLWKYFVFCTNLCSFFLSLLATLSFLSSSRSLIGGCNFIRSVEWFRNSSSDGRHPTRSPRPLRVPVLISRADIESVYYIVGDRSGDRSLGKVAGHFCSRWTWEWFWDGRGERAWAKMERRRTRGHLDASPRSQSSWCASARNGRMHRCKRAHIRERLRAAHDATHVSPRVCTLMQFVTRGTGIPPLK